MQRKETMEENKDELKERSEELNDNLNGRKKNEGANIQQAAAAAAAQKTGQGKAISSGDDPNNVAGKEKRMIEWFEASVKEDRDPCSSDPSCWIRLAVVICVFYDAKP